MRIKVTLVGYRKVTSEVYVDCDDQSQVKHIESLLTETEDLKLQMVDEGCALNVAQTDYDATLGNDSPNHFIYTGDTLTPHNPTVYRRIEVNQYSYYAGESFVVYGPQNQLNLSLCDQLHERSEDLRTPFEGLIEQVNIHDDIDHLELEDVEQVLIVSDIGQLSTPTEEQTAMICKDWEIDLT